MSVYPPDVEVHRAAQLSPDGLYRYQLERLWAAPGLAGWAETHRHARFVMLNPSTADAELDDPTVRRCVGFARAMGCGRLTVLNLYAYRATKPADLWKATDPVGPDNDRHLFLHAREAARQELPMVAAWGAHARPDRVDAVRTIIADAGAELTALGVTAAGAPRHPLYLPAAARPSTWPAP